MARPKEYKDITAPIDLDYDNPIWERQKGEKNLWYQRFVDFLHMGARRNLRAAYNAELARDGRDESKAPPESWRNAHKRNRWDERAEAYDAHRRAEEARILEALQFEALELRRQKLDEMMQLISEEMGAYHHGDIKALKDLMTTLAAAFKEMRIDLGVPSDRTDITTDGKALTPSIDDMHNIFKEIRALEDAMEDDADEDNT